MDPSCFEIASWCNFSASYYSNNEDTRIYYSGCTDSFHDCFIDILIPLSRIGFNMNLVYLKR